MVGGLSEEALLEEALLEERLGRQWGLKGHLKGHLKGGLKGGLHGDLSAWGLKGGPRTPLGRRRVCLLRRLCLLKRSFGWRRATASAP